MRMLNRKLRNIRPSGGFWPEGHMTPKGWKGVRMRNRKLDNIHPIAAAAAAAAALE
jgi:hypothetical protein